MPEDAVPDAEAITQKLMAGVGSDTTGSSPDDGSPSPETGGENASGSPDQQKSLMDKIASLEGQLETQEKRIRDNQSAFHDRNDQLNIAQEMLRAEEMRKQREAQMARAAEAMRMPDIEDPDELLDDPQRLKDYVQQVAKWSAGQGAMYAHQLNQQLQMALPRFTAIVEAQKHHMVDQTAAKLEEYGLGDDFKERIPEIEKKLSAYGDPTDLMLQENMLLTAYQLDRNERNLPMFAEKKPQKFPAVGGKGRLSRQDVEKRKSLSPMIQNLQKNLGLPDWVPDDNELRSRGL